MSSHLGAVQLAHNLLKQRISLGDVCIDCTAGRGNDTALLCSLVGKTGKVIAFDIQEEAIESTKELIHSMGYEDICELHLESHLEIDKYANKNEVSAIVFNFGWLPKGDHSICTKKETSIPAIKKGLNLLKKNGVMSLSIYYGKDTGAEEKDAIMEYIKSMPSKEYTVIVSEFANRPNCPPISVAIFKE